VGGCVGAGRVVEHSPRRGKRGRLGRAPGAPTLWTRRPRARPALARRGAPPSPPLYPSPPDDAPENPSHAVVVARGGRPPERAVVVCGGGQKLVCTSGGGRVKRERRGELLRRPDARMASQEKKNPLTRQPRCVRWPGASLVTGTRSCGVRIPPASYRLQRGMNVAGGGGQVG
jgi:hypothetical protein